MHKNQKKTFRGLYLLVNYMSIAFVYLYYSEWKEKVTSLKRPASAILDAFMFPNDDSRVLKGRQRLADEEARSGRVDWARCERYACK